MSPRRRELLEIAGVTATAAAVGTTGWLTVATQEEVNGELPAYSRWLTLEETLTFTYVDWESIGEDVEEELEDAADEADAEVPTEYEDDPMIAPVSEELISVYFFVGLDLAQYRLGRLLEDDAFESTVEELLRTDEALIASGAIVPEEIDDELTAEPPLEFIRQMERTAEIDTYDVYTPVDADVDAAFAVDSDAVVFVDGEDVADDPVAVLETTIGTAEGDGDRATDDSEAFAWLLETAGRGDVAVGQYGGPFDADELVHPAFEDVGDAEGIVASLTAEDEETSAGDFAAIVDDPDEDELEGVLGVAGPVLERSVDVDGDRVVATATWQEEDWTDS
ncbi:hypothetical protein [Natrialbaceae archaeon AArc-T1-2]|uniref:hypothetical protein n=1 Tax=Natrialbaceae archaeon AArc-T1-2 TaxID=3053904 RepID=UPI00255B05CD|nr:hypothetical protein [Natrialbaceae archaeon AArc-T1-2]WIV66649.1 hypothetical protein QQ977_13255 [Natrialbaceae archaeon AArc-T1-2]